MKDCKKCDNTRTIRKILVFVDRRGVQHECERLAPCPCLQNGSKPKDGPELLRVNSEWERQQYLKEKREEEIARVRKHLDNGMIRRRAA